MTVERTVGKEPRGQESTIDRSLRREYIPDKSWGELSEQITYIKDGEYVFADIYCTPDGKLFTVVNRLTGEVICQEQPLQQN